MTTFFLDESALLWEHLFDLKKVARACGRRGFLLRYARCTINAERASRALSPFPYAAKRALET